MDGLKRKHVVFAGGDEEPQMDAPAGAEMDTPAIAGLHPSRAAVVDWHKPAPAKKPKVPKAKTDKKKKYLAKKQRAQRAKKGAAKASAPKNSAWTGDTDEDVSDDSDDEEDTNAAGPSTAPATTTTAPEASAAPTRKLTDEEQTREDRRAEKAAIRDARREERKVKRKEERLARAAKEAKKAEREKAREERAAAREEAGEDAEEEDGADDVVEEQVEEAEDDGEIDMASDDERVRTGDTPDLPTRRSPSPPPLEPFPLPRMAAAPSDAVLSRQGMPTGLSDAEFIDQNTRLSVSALSASLGSGSAGLSERTQKRLGELGVEDFFAVQAAMLPHLLSLPLVPLPYAPLSDYLVSAPTGSGKTLAYAIPVVEVLAKRVVPRLRALIVLPTRDLVVQVRETLEALAKGSGLMIGSVTGQHSFAQEQAMLVGDSSDPLLGGASKLDILIATPGRLMDHLAATPNFTLQHLRFLVIDEADRLLTQSFQNWLTQVLAHAAPPPQKEGSPTAVAPYDAVAPAWAEPLGVATDEFEGSEGVPSTCQKLLFSATLTRDPAKVAALNLSSPRYYIVQSSSNPLSSAAAVGSSFALPAELSEKMLILPPALKPLNLLHLIHAPQFNATPALVFAKSVEAATRLVQLLDFFEAAYVGGRKVVVQGYTRDMPGPARKRLLAEFAEGKIDVLVASDLVARGMDLPAVAHVVSYDVPLDMTKYVHRAGRTARAGRAGTVWTLVEKQEAIHFKNMLKGAGHEKSVRKVKVSEDELAGYRESYDIAMRRLKEVYARD